MRILRDLKRCPPAYQGSVLALGNFEGVHKGHQAILEACVSQAKALGVAPAAMTFSPHPREFFGRAAQPLRLQSFRQKMALFEQYDIACTFVARFNADFAAMSARAFVEDILHHALDARHVVTGANFAFGRGRGGDTDFLANAAKDCGMGFTACAPVLDAQGRVVSSSAIRGFLAEGEMRAAAALLSRPYSIEGRVVHGDKRGRELGMPTANIRPGKLFTPRYGVYAARMRLAGGRVLGAVANLGIRPMFESKMPLLEAHAFGFEGDLYGQRICVELLDFMREERYFDSLAALQHQMTQDAAQAQALLSETYAFS